MQKKEEEKKGRWFGVGGFGQNEFEIGGLQEALKFC
jgi:hypothetical protein